MIPAASPAPRPKRGPSPPLSSQPARAAVPEPKIQHHTGYTVVTRYALPDDADQKAAACHRIITQELRRQGLA